VTYGVQLFFGKSWTGKTARMLHELRAEPRVLLVDPKCAQLTSLPRYQHFWPEYSPALRAWKLETAAPMIKSLGKCVADSSEFRCVIHFRDSFRENLEFVAALSMALRDCVLAVDECGLFMPPGPAGALPPKITNVVVSGTHDRVRFMGTAQRPSLVHGTVRANAARMFFYRLTEAGDLPVVANYVPPDLAKRVPTLPDYCCVEWTDGGTPFADYSLRGRFSIPGKR
jgi:hypothetical protein